MASVRIALPPSVSGGSSSGSRKRARSCQPPRRRLVRTSFKAAYGDGLCAHRSAALGERRQQ
jgi:hypothetical protein